VFERFSDTARRCVVSATEAALDLGHRDITVLHLFLGATTVLEETGDDLLEAKGVTVQRLLPVVKELRPPKSTARASGGHIPFTPAAKKTLELSLREALRRGENEIHPRHLLLSALENPDDDLDAVLAAVGLSAPSLRAEMERTLPPPGPRGPFRTATSHRLDRIETLLTEVRERLDRIERRLDSS
jgi:ATP-dependent Clp protease ATP-binding subunit ClpC